MCVADGERQIIPGLNIEFEFEQHALLALQIVQVVLEELSRYGQSVWTSVIVFAIYIFKI